jgi:hypothetical protein
LSDVVALIVKWKDDATEKARSRSRVEGASGLGKNWPDFLLIAAPLISLVHDFLCGKGAFASSGIITNTKPSLGQ